MSHPQWNAYGVTRLADAEEKADSCSQRYEINSSVLPTILKLGKSKALLSHLSPTAALVMPGRAQLYWPDGLLDIMPACTPLRLESSLLELPLMCTWNL